MNRITRHRHAQEAVNFITKGYYESHGQHPLAKPLTTIYLQANLINQVKNANNQDYISLDNRFVRDNIRTTDTETNISVIQTTSLGAAEILVQKYPNEKIAVLNFASAKNPGGGFLSGANAQEESLARSSTLYASLLEAKVFYQVNEAANSRTYTHNIIYSSDVTVFRDAEETKLLTVPYKVDMITCPAVNRNLTNKLDPGIVDEIMVDRAIRILAVAAKHNVKHLVLGAWGCGVFKNDPRFVANMFLRLLRNQFNGAFSSVIFAIPDTKIYSCFDDALGK